MTTGLNLAIPHQDVAGVDRALVLAGALAVARHVEDDLLGNRPFEADGARNSADLGEIERCRRAGLLRLAGRATEVGEQYGREKHSRHAPK
jgi:hypothetical protein